MPHATRPGDVLADRYRLVDLLSESGDGRFWRAHDRILERHVAVHVIRADDSRAEALMAAARRSATVLDPRILRVLDADATDEVCYVVNEWGWGASLDIVAAGTGPLGPRRSAWLVSEVAAAVATAHRAGVAHGRLNPENVLIDRTGGVRIIGLCVDAALHGVPDVDLRDDLTDLAGLLYCALTARWGGRSGSIVTPAPREHGEILRPRQVRAGIPRPLDSLCEEILHSHPHARHREAEGLPGDAQGIADYLSDFVGDPTGMALSLLASTPPVLPDEELVVLPQVPELTPHDTAVAAAGRAAAELLERRDEPFARPSTDTPDDSTAEREASPEPPDRSARPESPEPPEHVEDLPTEAGMPIFGPDGDDVSWLERRTTPAPPPPPFESPPERPLFAPDPVDGAPSRQRRDGATPVPVTAARQRDGYWPWDTGVNTGTGVGVGPGLVDGRGLASSTVLPVIEDDRVPGRSFFRLGTVLSVVVLLVVAVVIAVSLGQGSGDPDDAASPSPQGSGAPRIASVAVEGVSATAFDPLGTDGAENDEDAANVVDGDPDTTWATQSYNDQLGPPLGLKTGVGLALDLGGPQLVTGVDLSFLGSPTAVSLYLTDEPPTSVTDLEPVAEKLVKRTSTSLSLQEPTSASYAVVWLTQLPADGSLFRARIAELEVLAVASP